MCYPPRTLKCKLCDKQWVDPGGGKTTMAMLNVADDIQTHLKWHEDQTPYSLTKLAYIKGIIGT